MSVSEGGGRFAPARGAGEGGDGEGEATTGAGGVYIYPPQIAPT